MVAAILALAAPSFAQTGSTPAGPHAVGEYAGVVPGRGNAPPRSRAVRRTPRRGRTARLLTWPGFQARPNGASRFFVQVSDAVQTDVQRTDGRVEVVLRQTRVHLRNSRRPLETRFFNTPVTRATVERRGRHDLAIVFNMRGDATPRVYTEAGQNGYHFVFIEFPEGNWLPEAMQQPVAVPDMPESRPEDNAEHPDSSFNAMDDERPPSM